MRLAAPAPAGLLAPIAPLSVAAPSPATLEAHAPPAARDAVRLLVVGLPPGTARHARFADLPSLLAPGDLLVVNASATLPAALAARRADGRGATLHLSTPAPGARDRWVVELRHAGGRVRDGHAGERLSLPAGASACLLEPYRGSRLWVADLTVDGSLHAYLDRHGEPIRYAHVHGRFPLSAYQTIFASEPGSAEMPSAGRPFTAAVLTRLAARGIDVAPIVLHTGVSSLEHDEPPYPERFHVPAATADRIAATRGRVLAVGTTVVRALESAAGEDGTVRAAAGWTDLVIGPERPVHSVDGILSGFHDAGASHLHLLEAVAGRGVLARAAHAATGAGYRRHEFGDVQLLVREQRALRAIVGRPAAKPVGR